jgi:endonuclease/exonuclease/phosphatase family metal-dependent hydrolase
LTISDLRILSSNTSIPEHMYAPYRYILLLLITSITGSALDTCSGNAEVVRFASYNVSMFREGPDALREELQFDTSSQIRRVAAVIQHVRPDVLALIEFDYDPTGESINLFRQNYLENYQHGTDTIIYPYAYQVPSNTGVLSPVDINGDEQHALPADAYGFGRHPGQYAFALLSKFPIHEVGIRSFQKLLWKDMPDARLPTQADGSPYYTQDVIEVFRLSSKNHVDIPILIDDDTIHVILAHPTPPVFDGPEDANGLRNYDEIRLLKDYVENARYLVDDKGVSGGLGEDQAFVIMGDLNADATLGDSAPGAIGQLLKSPRVLETTATGDLIPVSRGAAMHTPGNGRPANAQATSFFGLRADYVLPSTEFGVTSSGVLWPENSSPLHHLVEDRVASDHLLVWVDVTLP